MVRTVAYLVLVAALHAAAIPVEEYTVRGPGELHTAAIDTFIKERERDPANKETGSDTPVMRRAREHAVKRFSAVPKDSLRMQVICVTRCMRRGIHITILCYIPSRR